MSKFYGVAHGFKRGVFEDWAEVQKLTTGFPQSSFKKFETREDAEKFVEAAKPARIEYASPEEDSDKWYAVARGKVVGVFTNYDDVKKHIEGYSQPLHKKFDSFEEAKAFVEKMYEGKGATEHEEKKSVTKTEGEKKGKEDKNGDVDEPVARRETRSVLGGAKPTTFYAVARGHTTGVFTDWAECKAATTGFKGAKFKKFDNKKEAEMFATGKTLKQIADAKRPHSDEESEEASPPKKTKKTAKA